MDVVALQEKTAYISLRITVLIAILSNTVSLSEGVVSDRHFTERKDVFDSPMALVENFKIDGKTPIKLAPEIEDIEPI